MTSNGNIGPSASQAESAGSIPVTGSDKKPPLTSRLANSERAVPGDTVPKAVPNEQSSGKGSIRANRPESGVANGSLNGLVDTGIQSISSDPYGMNRIESADDSATCQYPLAADRMCPNPRQQRGGGPGAPSLFCDDPTHTARRAYDRRQQFKRQEAKAAARQPATITRPVTDRLGTLAGLVEQLHDIRDQFAATLHDAGELIGLIADPASLAAEIDQIQRECERRVIAEQEARADAERRTALAERERDAARAGEAIANAAADEAIAERDEALKRATRVVDEAKQQIAEAQAEAEAEKERVYAEAEDALRQAREKVAAASNAEAVAVHEKQSAMRVAEARVNEAQQLRADIQEERAEHHAEITALQAARVKDLSSAHATADANVKEIRQQHAAELDAIRKTAATDRAELRRDVESARAELGELRRQTISGEPRKRGTSGVPHP